jgi:hypothetical protein
MRKLIALTVVLSLALFAGCKEKSPEEKGKEALKAAAAAVPDSPEKVVLEAAKAAGEGNYVLIYAMLPESYQKDLQGMYKKIADKVDAEMYGKVWATADKAFAAVKKNKDTIAKGGMVPAEMLEQGITTAEAVITLAKEMKLNDAAAMKALDIAAFLAENGKKLHDFGWKTAEQFQKDDAAKTKEVIASVKAELKGEVKDDKATVAITVAGDTKDTEFVKVEGKWIPAELAAMWPEFKKEADKNIDEALAELEKNKAKINEMLGQADTAIAAFEKDGNMEALAPLMGAMGGM